MDIIDEKIIVISILGIIYVISSFIKISSSIRIILNTIITLFLIIWLVDFFNIYPLLELLGYKSK